jgi:hypothetical protein
MRSHRNLQYKQEGVRADVSFCGKKVKFDKKAAVSAANLRWEEDHMRLRIYPCHKCGGWHLTKQVQKFHGN